MYEYTYRKHIATCNGNADFLWNMITNLPKILRIIRTKRILGSGIESNLIYPQSISLKEEGPCSICHVEFKITDNICITQCNHKFHCECIEKWNGPCPMCRTDPMKPFIKPAKVEMMFGKVNLRQLCRLINYLKKLKYF